MNGVFRTIGGKPIFWTDGEGITHRCEGGDLHPDIRLIWTDCARDVPSNAAFTYGDGTATVNCSTCIAKEKGRVMDEPEIRLCRDCRWIERGASTPKCLHASSTYPARVNLVDGKTEPARQLLCESARSILIGGCGEQGRFWEAA